MWAGSERRTCVLVAIGMTNNPAEDMPCGDTNGAADAVSGLRKSLLDAAGGAETSQRLVAFLLPWKPKQNHENMALVKRRDVQDCACEGFPPEGRRREERGVVRKSSRLCGQSSEMYV